MATAFNPSIAAVTAPSQLADSGDTALVMLQSLLCMLREKNLLSRADIEDLADRVRARAADHDRDPMPCCGAGANRAADEMDRLGTYIGQRYGGKHRRSL